RNLLDVILRHEKRQNMSSQEAKSYHALWPFEGSLHVLRLGKIVITIKPTRSQASCLASQQSGALLRLIFCLESIYLTNQNSDYRSSGKLIFISSISIFASERTCI